MVMGVTYAGEIARVGASNDPQRAVELVCTNPRFVELASAKKPNFIVRLFNGALSFPRDWWYGATFLSTRVNLFGAEGKAATDATTHTCIRLIDYAIANPWLLVRTIAAVLGHLLHYPEFYGRQGTMMATGVALTALGAPFVLTAGVGVLNFIMATTGAVTRAVDNGATSLAELIIAAAIGDSDASVAHAVARQLELPVPLDGNYDLSSKDEEYMIYVLRGVLHCLRNPDEYLHNGERVRPQRTVAVGQVSSARPRGVMGSIPVGYETNALDAISGDNRIYNEWLRESKR